LIELVVSLGTFGPFDPCALALMAGLVTGASILVATAFRARRGVAVAVPGARLGGGSLFRTRSFVEKVPVAFGRAFPSRPVGLSRRVVPLGLLARRLYARALGRSRAPLAFIRLWLAKKPPHGRAALRFALPAS